jgi:hypothetical protein
LGGGPYGIVDDLYLRLVDTSTWASPCPPSAADTASLIWTTACSKALGTDLRYCWPGLLPNSPIIAGVDDDTFYDSYGQVWKRALPYYYAGEGILKEASRGRYRASRPLA